MPSSALASRVMRANTREGGRAERLLRSKLWTAGYRFRTHVGSLPGQPDIVFSRQRVAVFCDGDFWHGRHWPRLRLALERRANSRYWIAKIARNRVRDRLRRRQLRQQGWAVVQIWETDILADLDAAASKIRLRLRSD